MTERVVGVVGGLGPQATVELMQRVIRLVPAEDDRDHVRMIVDNNPKVPSRVDAVLGDGESPAEDLRSMAHELQSAGADFLVIPCNTAHLYYDDVANSVDIPVLDMLTLTRNRLEGTTGKVGLLASTSILKTRLYERYFPDFELLVPDERSQECVMDAIFTVKRGDSGTIAISGAVEAAQQLVQHGAEAVVLGCTEFSIVREHFEVDTPVIDPLQVLAEAIVQIAKWEGEIPERSAPGLRQAEL